MLKHLHRALGALLIAAACGGGDDGDGNGPPPDGNDDGVECGDGTCTAGNESFGSCPQDCPPVVNCGNGACDGDESCVLCAQDCGACPISCGDGACNGDETTASCAQDCPPVVDCGNDACDSGEDCATCAADCGCTGDQVCRSWEALGLALQCGTIPEDSTRYCGSACGHPNPLIDVLPGTWDDESGIETQDIGVDVVARSCDIPGHEAGDACVVGFGFPVALVLDGARLFVQRAENDHAEGTVLEEGRRIEYDYTPPGEGTVHIVWIKRP